HREGLPLHIAGLRIQRGDPAAHAIVAAGAADDDGILERERRGGDLHAVLIVQVLVPNDLAGLLVGRDHAAVEPGDGDDEVAPQSDATVAVRLLLARIHLPHDAALRARPDVDLVDRAPDIADVEEAVLDQRPSLDIFSGR